MSTLRVLHAVGTSAVGGTERFLADLVTRHRARGIESAICVLDAPGALAGAYAAGAERVEHLHIGQGRIQAIRRWRRLLESFAPDVVVLYGARANLLGRLTVAGRGPALVNALRSTVPDDRGWRAAPVLDRWTFSRLTACVSNSQAALAALVARGYPAARLAYIPPGIAPAPTGAFDRVRARRDLGVGLDEIVLLCVANLKPVKNHARLLRASAALTARGITHRLWLVGDGPERERLERLARELGASAWTTFTGHEPDPALRYAAADVFVLPSRWEGSPMSVMEAMAAGLPVVATRVGDVPDLIVDGHTGRLVPADGDPALVAALAEAVEQRARWGAEAARRAAAFSADVSADRYAALFTWAAQRRGELPARYLPGAEPRRILRVLSRLNVGGPTLHVVLLTERMAARGAATCLVSGTVADGEGDMSYFAAERGVPVQTIPSLGRSVSPLRDCVAAVSLVRLMFRFRPDVVHTHASKGGALGRAAATVYNLLRPARRRAVVVHTYHGHTFEGYFAPLPALVFRAVERLLARVSDRIVVLSPRQQIDVAERFAIARADRIRIVPLGLDLDACFAVDAAARAQARLSLGLQSSDKAIVTIGRLTPIKNHAMLLQAFAALRRRHDDVRLLIAGDGELRQQLGALADQLGVGGRVRFLGWRRDVVTLYAAADVVALSSINEGTPVALIEAAAAGCPVVSTEVGGVPDVVDPDIGILVASTAAALGEGLAEALRRGRLSMEARNRMRRFCIDRLVDDLDALYDELLAGRTRHA
jgi:glycosyltransferase involved in cell wall biosynthesis